MKKLARSRLLRIQPKSLVFGSKELPNEDEWHLYFVKSDALPLVKRIWRASNEPLHLCTFSISPTSLRTLETMRDKEGLPFGKLIVNVLKHETTLNHQVEKVHAKVYVAGSYVILSSSNLTDGTSLEFVLLIQNRALAKSILGAIFDA